MKQKVYTLLVMMAFVTGCNNGDEDTPLSVDKEEMVCNADTRQQTLQVTTDGSWTAESNVNWCEPVKKNGTGNGQLLLWVSPNLTGEPRQGTLTITACGTRRTVSIRQPAYSGSLDEYEYHLLVVFHVLYNDEGDEQQYVRKGYMDRILTEVNRLYAQNDMHITFEPAQYDDNGDELEEHGVVRHKVEFSDYDPVRFLSSDNEDNRQYARYAQNLKRYINVFLFRFRQTVENQSSIGLSNLPVMPKAHPLDSLLTTDAANDYTYVRTPWGCCINNEYIYEWQDDGTVNPNYIVNIVAHELGHYIGLLHTFSMDECNMDDACPDTHICDYMSYIDYITAYIRQQQEAGVTTFSIADLARRKDCQTAEEYTAHNIMDYAYCYNDELTNQQRRRTREVLRYSPLVPGPKLTDYQQKTTRGNEWPRVVPVRIQPCPAAIKAYR